MSGLKFKPEDVEFIKANFMTLTDTEIGKIIGRPKHSITNFRTRNRLFKGPDFPYKGHFPKGFKPWNTGLKGVCTGGKATQFKKGNRPPQYKEEEILIWQKTGEPPYKYFRYEVRKRKRLHHWVWEQANGPIPKSHVIAFLNGDTLDCRIENLKLVSREELAHMNRDLEKANQAAKNLSDKYIAGQMTPHNKGLRKLLLQHPEIIDLKRTSLLLNRAIKDAISN